MYIYLFSPDGTSYHHVICNSHFCLNKPSSPRYLLFGSQLTLQGELNNSVDVVSLRFFKNWSAKKF